MVIDHNLPVCHPLTEVMGIQHYRPYEALLLSSHPSLVVFKEKSCRLCHSILLPCAMVYYIVCFVFTVSLVSLHDD